MNIHNKLVRDKIPDIIKHNGDTAVFHIAKDDEYIEALHKKVYEEVEEFLEDPSVEEVADVLEVLLAICDYHGVDTNELEAVRQQKKEQRGGFEQRIILDETH